jgi:hypothetical protein
MLDSHIFRHRIRFVSWLLLTGDRLIYRYLPFMRKYSYVMLVDLTRDSCRARPRGVAGA